MAKRSKNGRPGRKARPRSPALTKPAPSAFNVAIAALHDAAIEVMETLNKAVRTTTLVRCTLGVTNPSEERLHAVTQISDQIEGPQADSLQRLHNAALIAALQPGIHQTTNTKATAVIEAARGACSALVHSPRGGSDEFVKAHAELSKSILALQPLLQVHAPLSVTVTAAERAAAHDVAEQFKHAEAWHREHGGESAPHDKTAFEILRDHFNPSTRGRLRPLPEWLRLLSTARRPECGYLPPKRRRRPERI